MTDNNHPIIPPQELMQQWMRNYFGTVFNGELSDLEKYLVTQASQWGYEKRGAVNESELQKARDEELEACCKWLDFNYPYVCITMLRADRRPEPPSLKEQALQALDCLDEELEACCKWLDFNYPYVCITMLRADRRPEPPSLKEQALQALDCLCVKHTKATAHENTIRRALEQLDD